MSRFFFVVFLAIVLLPCPAPACSLCSVTLTRDTLGQEYERAKLVVYGWAGQSKQVVQTGATFAGGTTEFHLERILKNDPILGNAKVVTLPRYVPNLDSKIPPHFLIFGDVINGQLDPYLGKSVSSPAIIDYLENAKPLRAKDRVTALLYYARFLDHDDPVISEDAFLEFVKSSDAEVGAAAKKLEPERFRNLVKKPGVDAKQLGLFAFLLGVCGNEKDALLLRATIEQPSPANRDALDGFLGGYIALKADDGWNLTTRFLTDKNKQFTERYAALRAIRFYHGWQPAESRPHILRAYTGLIADGEFADFAVDDLRRWKMWDLTSTILSFYGKESHNAPIVRRGIVRYALVCPLPEARTFVETIRRQDPAVVRELEEGLQEEKEGK